MTGTIFSNWGLTSSIIIISGMIWYFIWFERSNASSKEVALITSLAIMAAAARIPFAVIPNVQPTTVLVIASGYTFGSNSGFLVGSLAALVSNMYLGQGPWTPWQMVAWGLAGASGGMLRRIWPNTGRAGLTLFSFAWGYVFGVIMTFWQWSAFIFPLTLKSFLFTYATGVWFDSVHAIGNAFFAYYLGFGSIAIMERFKLRLTYTCIERME